MSLPLRILFLLNLIATIAAAVVLFVAPKLIPAVAGVVLPDDALLVARLLGAYELGLAVLCGFVLRPHATPQEIRLGVWVLIAVHAAAALAEAITLLGGMNPVVLANLALRVALVVLFAIFYPRQSKDGARRG